MFRNVTQKLSPFIKQNLLSGSLANSIHKRYNKDKSVFIPQRHYDIPFYKHQRQSFLSQIETYADRETTTVGLDGLIRYGKDVTEDSLVDQALFIYHELPIRMAKAIKMLSDLPYGLSSTSYFKQVVAMYELSFRDLVSCLPPTTETEPQFLELVENILYRHSNDVPIVAQGVLSRKSLIKQSTGSDTCPYISHFLDKFYTARIAHRMLMTQYMGLHYPQPGYCGTIALKLNPVTIIKQACDDAALLCDRSYGAAPDVSIYVTSLKDSSVHDVSNINPQSLTPQSVSDNASPHSDTIVTSSGLITSRKSQPKVSVHGAELEVCYIPNHLHHIIFEIAKNSMRATVERFGTNHEDIPNINIVISSGRDEFTITVSDFGGGIPPEHSSKLFSWMHTTASSKVQQQLQNMNFITPFGTPDTTDNTGSQRVVTARQYAKQQILMQDQNITVSGANSNTPPIAGFGYGLPLSRLFAQYFGGDIVVRSVPGRGVDAYVFMKKLRIQDV